MEAATAFPLRQSASFHESEVSVSRESTRMLTATATYMLSEDGRKASLLSGGDGRALQEQTIQVPATRLHLVRVDTDGTARLKLRPRYQLNAAGAVTKPTRAAEQLFMYTKGRKRWDTPAKGGYGRASP